MARATAILRIAAIAATMVAVSGCATGQDAKPPVCDGRHRRPANPYGSVLPSIPTGPVAPPPRAGAPPPLPPGPFSEADPRSFARCGAGA